MWNYSHVDIKVTNIQKSPDTDSTPNILCLTHSHTSGFIWGMEEGNTLEPGLHLVLYFSNMWDTTNISPYKRVLCFSVLRRDFTYIFLPNIVYMLVWKSDILWLTISIINQLNSTHIIIAGPKEFFITIL